MPDETITKDMMSDCVSEKMKVLMAEGNYDQDQALAIAYKHCGEDKALAVDKMVMRPTQDEVNYVAVSLAKGQACSNCRWFHMMEGAPGCHLIVNGPLEIVPNGYCDRWEAPPDMSMNEPAPIPVTIVEPDMSMSMDKAEGYLAPDSNADSIFSTLADRFKHGLKAGASVFKVDGQRYMLVVTSNSYQDREKETIASQALREYVDACWKGDEIFYNDNPLLFWHDPRLKVGDIVYSDMRGPFLVEVAREAQGALAGAIFDYREKHPDEKWGASHKFYPVETHTSEHDKTYLRIRKKETSILPRSAAANVLTYSGVIPMADKRGEYLNKMLGLDNAAELLDKGIEALVEELNKRGVTHKSTDEKPVETLQKDFGKLLVALIDGQAAQQEALDALTARSKALDDEKVQQAATIKVLTDDAAKAKADAAEALTLLKQTPRRASQDSTTVLSDTEVAQIKKDIPTDVDTFWGNLGVPKEVK